LKLFEKYGFNPQKQVPIKPSDSNIPILVADFAIPEKRLAIYIDGASFHKGINLRRDRFIRDRLRNSNPPWQVIELRSSDLSRGESLVQSLSV
jgi:very-short-patch-repair endonuclease